MKAADHVDKVMIRGLDNFDCSDCQVSGNVCLPARPVTMDHDDEVFWNEYGGKCQEKLLSKYEAAAE